MSSALRFNQVAMFEWLIGKGIDPETVCASVETLEKAKAEYLAAHEEIVPSDPSAPTVKLMVAVVNGSPVKAERYVSQRGKSRLRGDLEDSLSTDASVMLACLRANQNASIEDFSSEQVALLSAYGRPEWQDFLAGCSDLSVHQPAPKA